MKNKIKSWILIALMVMTAGAFFLCNSKVENRLIESVGTKTTAETTTDNLAFLKERFVFEQPSKSGYTTQLLSTEHYNITSAEDLLILSDFAEKGMLSGLSEKICFIMTNDISLAGYDWIPIGTSSHPWEHAFLGNGYSIKDVKITEEKGNLGVFGVVKGGVIDSLTLSGDYIIEAPSEVTFERSYGSLIGKVAESEDLSSFIVDCYDEFSSKTLKLTDGGGNVIRSEAIQKTIGSIGGTNTNGVVISYGNKGGTLTSEEQMMSKIASLEGYYTTNFTKTINFDVPESANIDIFKWTDNTEYYQSNHVSRLWEEGKGKIRIVENIPTSTYFSEKLYAYYPQNIEECSEYSGATLVRCEGFSAKTGENERYPIASDFSATNGNIVNVTYMSKNSSVTFQNEVGGKNEASVPYGQSVVEFLIEDIKKNTNEKNLNEEQISAIVADVSKWQDWTSYLVCAGYLFNGQIEGFTIEVENYLSLSKDEKLNFDILTSAYKLASIDEQGNATCVVKYNPKILTEILRIDTSNITSGEVVISGSEAVKNEGTGEFSQVTSYTFGGRTMTATWKMKALSADTGSQQRGNLEWDELKKELKLNYCLDESYTVTLEMTNASIVRQGNAAGTDDEWNASVWVLGDDNTQSKITWSFKPSNVGNRAPWNNSTYPLGDMSTPFGDNGINSSFEVVITTDEAKVEIIYVDGEGNKIIPLGDLQGIYPLINGISFEGGNENFVPVWQDGENDNIVVYSNRLYKVEKVSVQNGSTINSYNLVQTSANTTLGDGELRDVFNGEYSGDFLKSNYTFDGNDQSVTTITITLNKQTYMFDAGVYMGDELIDETSKMNALYVLTHTFYSDGACLNKIEVTPSEGKYFVEWGTYVKTTFALSDLAKQLFSSSASLTSALCGEGTNNMPVEDVHSRAWNTINSWGETNGEYTIVSQVGAKDGRHNITLTKKSFVINVSSMVDNENRLVNITMPSSTAFEFDLTITDAINITTSNVTTKVALSSSSALPAVSIAMEYYLLGWYLQDGEVVETGSYDNIKTAFLSQILRASGNSNESEKVEFNDIKALVCKRQIVYTIHANPYIDGQGGQEEFYCPQTGETVTLAPSSNVIATGNGDLINGETLNQWNRIGCSFDKYTINIEGYGEFDYTANWFTILKTMPLLADLTIQLSDEGGNKFSFTRRAGENQFIAQTNTFGALSEVRGDIFANYKERAFDVEIDGNNSINFSYGQIVYAEKDSNVPDKVIYKVGERGSLVEGGAMPGYRAIGIEIKVSLGDSENTIQVNFEKDENGNYVNNGNFEFSFNCFKQLFDRIDLYDTSLEEPIITISTLREENEYKLFILTSENNYYNVSWNGENSDKIGQDENGIYVIQTYNKEFVLNASPFTIDGLSITRENYTLSGWNISLDVSGKFIGTSNATISPIFTWDNTYGVGVEVNFTQDAREIISLSNGEIIPSGENFISVYALNSHDIYSVALSGVIVPDGFTLAENAMLANGDKITGMKIQVYKYVSGAWQLYVESESSSYQTIFNYDWTQTAGVYRASIEVRYCDGLSSEGSEITSSSNNLYYIVEQNGLIGNFNSTYSPNGTIAPKGKVTCRYDWKGSNIISTQESDIEVDELFSSFSASGVFEVGSNREFLAEINRANLSSWFRANKTGGESEDLGVDFFSTDGNLTTSNFVSGIEGVSVKFSTLTIVRALYTIDFGQAYDFFNNQTERILVSTGRQQTTNGVTYQYSNLYINFVDEDRDGFFDWGVYAGSQNASTDQERFSLDNLYVEFGGIDISQNYTWQISTNSNFTLLGGENLKKFTFEMRSVSYDNSRVSGNEEGIVTNAGDGIVWINDSGATLSYSVSGISGVSIVDGKAFDQNGNIIYKIVGSATTGFAILINSQYAQLSNLTFTISVSIGEKYGIVRWLEVDGESVVSETDSEELLGYLECYANESDELFNSYSFRANATEMARTVLLSNVVVFEICHADGSDAQNRDAVIEKRYAAVDQSITIGTLEFKDVSSKYPLAEFEYEGISSDKIAGFECENGHVPNRAMFTCTNTDGSSGITTLLTPTNVGDGIVLMAQWKLIKYGETFTTNNVHVDVENPWVSVFDIISENQLKQFNGFEALSAKIEKGDLTYTVAENAIDGSFNITNAGDAGIQGEWEISITYRYAYKYGAGDNEITIETSTTTKYTFYLSIVKNEISISVKSFDEENSMYSGKEQSVAFEYRTIKTYTDANGNVIPAGSRVGEISFPSESLYYYSCNDSQGFTLKTELISRPNDSKENSYLFGAGEYKVKFSIFSGGDFDAPLNVYSLAGEELTFSLKPFEISMNGLNVALTDAFGSSVENPVCDYEVPSTGEIVKIYLDRETGLEPGTYALSNPRIENGNYLLTDVAQFVGTYEISESEGILQAVKISSAPIAYEYNDNAFKASDFSISSRVVESEGESKWISTIKVDGIDDLSFEIELFYMQGASKVYVTEIDSTNLTYAGGKDVGTYSITLEYGHSSVTIDGVISVTPKGLTLTKVEKVFDGNQFFNEQTSIEFSGLIGGDNVDVSRDNGRFESENAGNGIALLALSLVGEQSGNYYISNTDFKGTITPLAVNSVSISPTKQLTYGDLIEGEEETKTSINSLISKLGLSVSINNLNILVGGLNGAFGRYAAVEDWSGRDLSTSGAIKAGVRTIQISLSSLNFSGFSASYSVVIQVNQKGLDLRLINFAKDCDHTVTFPSDTTSQEVTIAEMIISGDQIEIDSNSHFSSGAPGNYTFTANAEEGENFFAFVGEDADNYVITGYPTGTINRYTIVISLSMDDEFVFVEDGKSINNWNGDKTYNISYPIEQSAHEIVSALNTLLPLRDGYTASWNYVSKEGIYNLLSEDSILRELENATTGRELSLQARWTIKTYNISVNFLQGNNGDVELLGENIIKENEENSIKYFDSLTFNVNANAGYKISICDLVGGYESCQIQNVGSRYLKDCSVIQVQSDIQINITFEQILITFNIEKRAPVLDGVSFDIIGNPSASYSRALSLLNGAYVSSLPVYNVQQGTFTHVAFLARNGAEVRIDSGINLQILLAECGIDEGQIERDTTITLTPVWQGESYRVFFDRNVRQDEVTTPEALDAIDISFGETIEGLPSLAKAGMVARWQCNRRIVNVGDAFSFVGSYDQTLSLFTVTMTAVWDGESYTLIVNINGERIESVTQEDGSEVASDDTFILVFSEDDLTLIVTSRAGYNIATNEDFTGEVALVGNRMTIKNITRNDTLYITGSPARSTLTINAANAKVEGVNADGEAQTSAGAVAVYTGQEIIITIVAEKGYEFPARFDNFSRTGSGTLEVFERTLDKLVLRWTGFTSDTTIAVGAIERVNSISIASGEYFQANSISFNGGSIANVETGKNLIIKAKLKYGYRDAGIDLTNNGDITLVQQINVWNDRDKVYDYTVELSGILEDEIFNFSASKRQYSFALSFETGMGLYASIPRELVQQTVYFGDNVELDVNVTNTSYSFVQWQINYLNTERQIVSLIAKTSLKIDENLQEALESVSHMESVTPRYTITAIIQAITIPINFGTNANGRIEITYNDSADTEVKTTQIASGTSATQYVLKEKVVQIKVFQNEGYHFSAINVNGSAINAMNNTYGITMSASVITFTANETIRNIAIFFEADTFVVSVVAKTQINFIESEASGEGGNIYLSDENGEKLDLVDSYLSGFVGYNYKFNSCTNAQVYFVVEAKAGYSATITCTNARIVSQSVEGKNVYLLTQTREGASVKAVFSARSNTVNVQFVVDGTNQIAQAGKMFIDTSSALISAVNNSSYSVRAIALTNGVVQIDAYTNFAYSLVEESGYPKMRIAYSSGTTDKNDRLSGQILSAPNPLLTGYTSHMSLSLSQVDESATIYIYVSPKVYNLRILVDDGEAFQVEQALVYGQLFNLNALSEAQKAVVFKSKTDYDLEGYFTKQLGQGNKYISSSGEILKGWTETGYTYDGQTYNKDANFDAETQTFTLYSSWTYKKAYISFDFVPEEMEVDVLKRYSITSFTTGLKISEYWIGNDPWYVEVRAKTTLGFSPVDINGYVFDKWIITPQDSPSEEFLSRKASYRFGNDNYTIVAVYKPIYTLTSYCQSNSTSSEGGTIEARQNGVALSGGAFDSTRTITLVAKADTGYEFVYFVNLENGSILYAQRLVDGEYIYEWSGLKTSPLLIRAVFKGSDVLAYVNTQDIESRHRLLGVYVNGTKISHDSQRAFTAHVGDVIRVEIIKNVGYGFAVKGLSFIETHDESGRYVFTYKVVAEDLIVEQNRYVLNATFESVRETITLSFVNGIDEGGSFYQSKDGGVLKYYSVDGKETRVESSLTVNLIFADEVYISFMNEENYVFAYLLVNDKKTTAEEFFVSEHMLKIDEAFMTKFYKKHITIKICFRTLLWTDDDVRSSGLSGEGSEENPYLIKTASDFGFVSYAVNNNLQNENGEYFAQAHYLVVNSINFKGRFWTPIGTKSCKFKGEIDLGDFTFSNVLLDKTYSEPKTSYQGLFLEVANEAVIIQDKESYWWIIGTVGGLIVFGALTSIAVLQISKRKREKLADYYGGVDRID